MDQSEVDRLNAVLITGFLKNLNPGEILVGLVTVRSDGKAIGWYPAKEEQSQDLLGMLAQLRLTREAAKRVWGQGEPKP